MIFPTFDFGSCGSSFDLFAFGFVSHHLNNVCVCVCVCVCVLNCFVQDTHISSERVLVHIPIGSSEIKSVRTSIGLLAPGSDNIAWSSLN